MKASWLPMSDNRSADLERRGSRKHAPILIRQAVGERESAETVPYANDTALREGRGGGCTDFFPRFSQLPGSPHGIVLIGGWRINVGRKKDEERWIQKR